MFNSPALCHNLVCRDLDCISLPEGITPFHYIDGTMLIRPGDQEIARTLDLLVKRLHVRGWDKSGKNPEGFYLREIARHPVVQSMLRYPC